MFFTLPILLSIGILYLLGEKLFYRRLHRWIFITVASLMTWVVVGISLWYQIGLGYFMETIDALGNPVNWFDGDLGKWMSWISSIMGLSFVLCTLLVWLAFLPLTHTHRWWEFWKK